MLITCCGISRDPVITLGPEFVFRIVQVLIYRMVSVPCLSMGCGKVLGRSSSLLSDDFHEISKILKITHPGPDLGPHGRIFRRIRVLPHIGDDLE